MNFKRWKLFKAVDSWIIVNIDDGCSKEVSDILSFFCSDQINKNIILNTTDGVIYLHRYDDDQKYIDVLKLSVPGFYIDNLSMNRFIGSFHYQIRQLLTINKKNKIDLYIKRYKLIQTIVHEIFELLNSPCYKKLLVSKDLNTGEFMISPRLKNSLGKHLNKRKFKIENYFDNSFISSLICWSTIPREFEWFAIYNKTIDNILYVYLISVTDSDYKLEIKEANDIFNLKQTDKELDIDFTTDPVKEKGSRILI